MGLQEYNRKRDFKKTREPSGKRGRSKDPIFVVQEHWASHHHFDFRLEAFGTLKSWAVPKGPSTKVGDKRLAVEVEDHPIAYAKFKGEIPKGEYGGGHVEIWDKGTWQPPEQLREQLKKGHLEFELKGKKLQGKWLLQRTQTKDSKSLWLLIKRTDAKKEKPLQTFDVGKVKPQLATLVSDVPKGKEWIHEIKWDGYRTFARIHEGQIQFITRSGLDWTEKYQELSKEFKKLKVDEAVIDGEIVVMNSKKQSHFSSLQKALSDEDGSKLQFMAFDLISLKGYDLREYPLIQRKSLLKELLKGKNLKKIHLSQHHVDGEALYKKMCKGGLEGIISKDKNSQYISGRTKSWLKIKCTSSQELVVGGYTEPQGSRQGFGSLLMGTFEEGQLRYVGKIGTGFNSKSLASSLEKLQTLAVDKSPFDLDSPKDSNSIHWVKPELVADVNFRSWTGDGKIRQGSFQGFRADKKAQKVIREDKDFKITHPERVLYEKGKVTKLDVANYYKSVSPWLLPHVTGRPLSFVRCPQKAGEKCFFQKHLDPKQLSELGEDKIRDQKVNFIQSEKGLLQLAQWGVLEIHTWQAHVQSGENPDQIVFDFDPDEGLSFKAVVDAVLRMKSMLEDLNLECFLKTTGGKGLHIHVPIAPKYTWEEVKEFSKTLTEHLAAEFPKLYTTNILKKERRGRIFLDYLRNGYGATAVAPYSLRSKERATVAFPISWKELSKIKKPDQYDLQTVLKTLSSRRVDPWKNYLKLKQKIQILEIRGKKK